MDEVDGMSGNDDRAGVNFEFIEVNYLQFMFAKQIIPLTNKLID